MIKLDEEALICDLAETYQIYDYKQLPPTKVAVFAAGLRDNARIKMKLSEQKVPFDTLLIAGIVDRLSILIWRQTKDGQKDKNKPSMLMDSLAPKEQQESDVILFNSGKDFEEMRNELIEDKRQEGGV